MFKPAALAAAFFVAGLSSAGATTVTVATEDGTAMQTVAGVRADTSTRGVDLAGMKVTATYADGSSEELTWAAYDAFTFGGVIGTGIDISMGFQGFNILTNKLLTKLSLAAGLANSIFDISTAEEGQPGNTPTTFVGFPLRFNSGTALLDGNVTATYSNIVNLAGRPADGDAFTDLMVDFSNVAAGGLLGAANFETDMDTLAQQGDLVPATVPVPASLPLLIAGLGGLGLLTRRKRHG